LVENLVVLAVKTGEAPDVVGLVGRIAELETCRNWILKDNCRLLTVLGMGGIGKTVFVARLAQDLVADSQCVYCRSLRDALPTSNWLAGAICVVSGYRLIPPSNESERLTPLLQQSLRERRTLLVLDNFEALFEPRQPSAYRAESAGHGRIPQTLGAGRVIRVVC
jgi:hypothetical protein